MIEIWEAFLGCYNICYESKYGNVCRRFASIGCQQIFWPSVINRRLYLFVCREASLFGC
jgi:hypothetical protein